MTGPPFRAPAGPVPRAFALATVWLCPAVLSVLGERVLTDGTRGPWLAQALAGSAAVSVILLAGPWARFGDHGEADLVDLVRQRFTRPGAAGAVLALASVLGTWLYLWAQLRAGRELARLAGWPAAAPTVGLGLLLVLLAWAPRLARPLSGLASTVALAALLLCLGTVLARTTPVWPGVWEEVASRGPARFSDQSPWTHAGGPVRGPGAELRVTVTEEQRLSLLAATPTRVERWDGTVATSYSQRGEALLLGPQDRLLVPDGTPIRFEAGRVIPGTPPSGPEWLDPAGPRADWRAAIGLLATLVLGGLGLGPVQAALPAGGADDRAGPLAAAVVALASLGTLLWALYALWLTPELYVGGLAAFEPYLMPAGVPHLGDLGALLAPLALAAVALAGVSSGLIALGAFRVVAKLATEANLEGPGRVLKSSPWSLGGMAGRGTALLAGAAAGALAILVPLDAWTVVVGAFGLAGATTGPATVLLLWRARLSSPAILLGVLAGLGAFAVLSIAGLGGPSGGLSGRLGPGPWSAFLLWLTAWPAVGAAALNLAVAWSLSRLGGVHGPGSRDPSRSPAPS